MLTSLKWSHVLSFAVVGLLVGLAAAFCGAHWLDATWEWAPLGALLGALIPVGWTLLFYPVAVARARGVTRLALIRGLCICGLFSGVSWLIALGRAYLESRK